jgi:predicted RNase H-like nuclease (RuvC/YqgF family)
MDDVTYGSWWNLHIRIARGETLTSGQQKEYEAGLSEMHAQEDVSGDIGRLRKKRSEVLSLEAEHESLQQRSSSLETEIAALESAMNANTRELLGVEG